MYIYKLLTNQIRSAVDIHRFSETALFRMIKEWPPSSGNFNEWNTHNSAVAIKPWISILKSWTDLSRTTTAPLRVENSFKYAPLKRKDISIPISMSSYSGMRKKTSVTHSSKDSSVTFLFLPHSDDICDLFLNRRTERQRERWICLRQFYLKSAAHILQWETK